MMVTKNTLDTIGFNKKDYTAKITEIEGKIPRVASLATTAAINAFKKKIPNISNLVKEYIMMQKYQIF